MRVATFNAADSLHALEGSLKYAGLVLWQEAPPHAARALGQRLDILDADVHRSGVATGWLRPQWASVGRSKWHKAHDGRERVTPKRGTLVTHLKHKRTGVELVVLNGHRINRTRGLWLAIPRVHARWRADRWLEHHCLDARLIQDLIRDGHRLIVYGGDYNRREVPPLHPDARRLTGAHIDQLWLLDLDNVFDAEALKPVRRLGSDHPLRRVSVTFRKA